MDKVDFHVIEKKWQKNWVDKKNYNNSVLIITNFIFGIVI